MIARGFDRVSFDARLVGTAALLACLVTIACDRAALLAPTNSSITLTASTRVLPTGGTAELTATVLENSGSPVPNGTTVRFTTNLGRIDPVEAQTRNGTATATFHAGTESGVAQIRAISGLASGGTTGGTATPPGGTPSATTAGNVVEITVGAAAAGSITLSANPSTVRPSGSSVEISAFVNDTNGNRLPNVPVAFSTTRGTVNPTVANTDANGVARTTLTASETATVTATVGGGAGTGTGGAANPRSATIEVRAATVASFTLSTAPATPSAGQPVSLTITPAANTAPRIVVNWGDNSNPQDIGVVSAARSVVHTYALPGFYTIEATGTSPEGDPFTNSIPVTVAQQPPVAVTVEPPSGPLNTNFAFTITPTTGALIQNIRIEFGTEGSQDLGPISTQTTVTRRFQTTGQKTVTVTQTETNGRVTTATVTVTVTS